jgi:hypothetical protein
VGNDAARDADGLRYYLERAWTETPTRKIALAARRIDEPLAAVDLDARLVVVAGGLSDAAAESLAGYLSRGGTVLYLLRDTAAKGLARLAGSEEIRVSEARVKDYVQLGQVSLDHPLFAPLADPRYSDFSKIHFWKHRTVELPESIAFQVPARFDDGAPAIVELTPGGGRLVVLASGWHPADSQLARSSKFVPLLAAMLEHPAIAANTGQQNDRPVSIADSPVNRAEWPVGKANRVVFQPDGRSTAVAVDGPSDQPGIYRWTSAGKSRELAVNVPAAESRVFPLDVEELQRHGVALGRGATRGEVGEQRRQLRDRELEGEQKLWQWLVLATAMVLVGETWLAGRSARRLATT